jgi:transglutaminase-like putative cysteine protease
MNREFFQQKSLASSFICAMFMVAIEVSPWTALLAAGLVIWKWGVEKLNWRPLSRRVTGILSVVILGQVLFQYRTLIGQEPSYTFLLGLSGLRIMDYRTDRDHKFLVLLGFILISIKALFNIDIYWVLPSALAFAGLWYSMLPDAFPQKGRILTKIFLLSAPGTLLLFFAFPRFVLPWAMSRGPNQGQIGFSDELNPGGVAELASTSVMAFRAKLSNLPIKNSQELYWRGSVLTQSRGLSWRPGRVSIKYTKPNFRGPTYEVALEPHSSNYIFTLDGTKAVQMETGTVLPLQASVYRASRPISATTTYRGAWEKNFNNQEVPDEDSLTIPELKGKVLEWVNETKAANPTENERIEALQKFFSQSRFVYTLHPGIYGINDLEAFLFYRKRGFCEHYAGSYATLARALGIPARVVIGYQGGRYNPVGEFWRINQRDAHAWVEIYHDKIWQRIDPTAWVAPLRMIIGAEEFFDLSEMEQRAFARDINWRPPNSDQSLLWDRLTFLADDLNYRWTYFLVEFDRTAQQSFWTEIADLKLEVVFGLLFVLIICMLLLRSLFKTKSKLSEEQFLIAQIQEWGTQQRLPRGSDETPLRYLSRLGTKFPEREPLLSVIQDYYDQKIYAGKQIDRLSAKDLTKRWKSQVK